MNGLILLEDLEEEDLVSDYKRQNQRSNNHTNNNSKYYNNHSHKNGIINGGGTQTEVKRANKPRDTPNHLMVDGHFHHRRKSISAEPLPAGDLSPANGHGGRDTPISINGHYSSLSSVNNAITVAPSRTTFTEPNVFAGGRSHHRKQHHHQHRKHKVRSRSPSNDPGGGGQGYQSILNRIDNSILKNFGDWTNVDDEGLQRKNNRSNHNHNNNNNTTTNNSRNNKVPYFIPKPTTDPDELSRSPHVGYSSNNNPYGPNDLLSLPKLYKGYDHVCKSSNEVLNDKSYRIALSKDNNDPDSILSEAKRTLAQFGGRDSHAD